MLEHSVAVIHVFFLFQGHSEKNYIRQMISASREMGFRYIIDFNLLNFMQNTRTTQRGKRLSDNAKEIKAIHF